MAIADNEADDLDHLNLPPGYRFHPTDEELIGHYLTQKVLNTDFTATAIGEVDLNKCEPWDLPKKAKMGEKEWYFFCQKDRKYPTGMRTNRATESGYWKATGKDKEIYRKGRGGGGRQLVGMKKTLVFYKGRAPRGEKTNWVMHEFRLEGEFSYKKPKDAEWVVCMVFHKKSGMVKTNPKSDVNSFVEGLLDNPSMPTLIDSSNLNNNEEDFKKRAFTEASVKTIDKNSISYYPTNMNNIYQPQMQPHNNTFNPANYQIDPTPSYQILNSENANTVPYQASSSSPGNYLSQQMINSIPMSFPGQCKVEQFSSNQSMVSRSQDTGLSTDMTTEISPKQEVNRSKLQYEAIEDIEGTSDFDSFWSF